MGDTNRVRLSYQAEGSYKAAVTGNYNDFRYTGENLALDTTTVRSNEIRSDRQTTDLIRTDIKVGGTVDFEMSSAGGAGATNEFPDDFFLWGLFASAWSAAVTVTASTIAAVNATAGVSRFTDSGNGFGVFAVNQWIRTNTFTNAANGSAASPAYFKITAVAAGQIDCVGFTATVTEAAGASRTIKQGQSIENGTTGVSINIERAYEDIANEFVAYAGCMIDKLSKKVSANAIITGQIGLIGATETSGTASTGSGYNAANSNEVMEAIDHVPVLIEGTILPANAFAATEISWEVANNLRARAQIGTLGAISIGIGSFNVTGALRAYYASKTTCDKYINNQYSALAYVLQADSVANAYVFDFPKIKYSAARRVAGGKDQDVMMEANWEAIRHGTEGKTMRIVRFP